MDEGERCVVETSSHGLVHWCIHIYSTLLWQTPLFPVFPLLSQSAVTKSLSSEVRQMNTVLRTLNKNGPVADIHLLVFHMTCTAFQPCFTLLPVHYCTTSTVLAWLTYQKEYPPHRLRRRSRPFVSQLWLWYFFTLHLSLCRKFGLSYLGNATVVPTAVNECSIFTFLSNGMTASALDL